MKLGADSLPDLSLGAVFLATGGGGDPYLYQLALRAAIAEKGPVPLIAPDDLDDDAARVMVGIEVDDGALRLAALSAHTGGFQSRGRSHF